MINYLKSERYRLTRKISLHITSIVACALIIVAGFVLYFFGKMKLIFRMQLHISFMRMLLMEAC